MSFHFNCRTYRHTFSFDPSSTQTPPPPSHKYHLNSPPPAQFAHPQLGYLSPSLAKHSLYLFSFRLQSYSFYLSLSLRFSGYTFVDVLIFTTCMWTRNSVRYDETRSRQTAASSATPPTKPHTKAHKPDNMPTHPHFASEDARVHTRRNSDPAIAQASNS